MCMNANDEVQHASPEELTARASLLTAVCVCVCVFPQSDVPIDLLDVDKSSAVVSFSECDSEVRLRSKVTAAPPYPLLTRVSV